MKSCLPLLDPESCSVDGNIVIVVAVVADGDDNAAVASAIVNSCRWQGFLLAG